MSRLRFFLSLLAGHWATYLTGSMMLAATLWMSLAIPRLLQKAIDLLGRSPAPQGEDFAELIGWILGFAVIIMVTRTFSRMMFFTPGRRVEFALKNRLLKHLSLLGTDYFSANPTGSIISRVNNDINGIRMTMGFGLLALANSLATLSLAPYYMYVISPRLTLYSLVPVAVGVGVLLIGVTRMRSHQFRQMESLQELSDFVVESYNGIDAVKSHQAFSWVENRFDRHNGDVMESQVKIFQMRALFMPVLNNMVNALKVMLVLVGGLMVVRGEISPGNFLAYLLYLSMMLPPLMGLTFLLFVLQRGLTAADSILSILNTPPAYGPGAPQAEEALRGSIRQGIQVNHLTFAYPSRPDKPVLNDVSLNLSPGEIVGVFGPVGSGKTTLVNLLNRYLDPPPGTITMEGQPLQSISVGLWRAKVVTVTQDPFLFSDTVRENIQFGAGGEPVAEEVMQAAVRAAQLEADLARFPQGLETQVGEKGISLSGGQKQRIALARAMMRPCELLMLDDPLSAVDHETERKLISTIYGFQHSRALLIVSHRVSVLERANRILVLEDGRVTAQGTHQALIAQEGAYRQAWRLQSEQHPPGGTSIAEGAHGSHS
ncbi:MAG: ABC transporter ATP-binding protein/permease [Deltaproteobacteria bacterium]|nr:ABC transporter ATP-binding protein/permease [Deltaproteobacteria bacterium]